MASSDLLPPVRDTLPSSDLNPPSSDKRLLDPGTKAEMIGKVLSLTAKGITGFKTENPRCEMKASVPLDRTAPKALFWWVFMRRQCRARKGH